MIEGLILGIVQGVAEWLPVSSSGLLSLINLKFFGGTITESLSLAVFLHLGTFLAAFVYFRKEIINLFKRENKQIFWFLFWATFVTGLVGIPVFIFGMKILGGMAVGFTVGLIGVFLVVTGLLQIKKPEKAFKIREDLKGADALVVGALQGISVVPGFSRSGLTVAGFLFRKFQETESLKLSFLMSLPAVLGGNIVVNLFNINKIDFGLIHLIALIAAFVVSLLTIDFLLKVSRKINFGWFAIGFGVLTLISVFFV